MGCSTLFQDPWDILWELGPILEEINFEYPNVAVSTGSSGSDEEDPELEYRHSDTYSECFSWKKRIEQCSWKLPTVHLMLIKQQKIKLIAACCNIDVCKLLEDITRLRPATKEKVLDESWRDDYEENVHEKLCCILNVEQEEELRDVNTYDDIEEIPNFGHNGLPGFSYPNHRIPPIVELIRPVEPRGTGSRVGLGAENSSLGDIKEEKEQKGWFCQNVDPKSRIFGPYNKMPDTFTSSPLKTRRSWICREGMNGRIDDLLSMGQKLAPDETKDFDVTLPCCRLIPNLKGAVDVTVTLDECESQYIPPMFLPKHRLDVVELGDGEEIGIYSNYKLISHNFGTGFKIDSKKIGPLTITDPFSHDACENKKAPKGIDRERSPW